MPLAEVRVLLAPLTTTLEPVPDEAAEFEAEALLDGSEVLAPLTTTLEPVPDEAAEFEAEALLDGSEVLAPLTTTLEPVPDEAAEFEAEALLDGSEVLAPLTTTLEPVPDEAAESEAEALLDGSEMLLPESTESGVLVDTDKTLLVADERPPVGNVNKLDDGLAVMPTMVSPGAGVIVKPTPVGTTNLFNPLNEGPIG